MSLIQLLKFKKWEMRLFKMPRFETLRFQRGTKVTVASGLCLQPVTVENYLKAFTETPRKHFDPSPWDRLYIT